MTKFFRFAVALPMITCGLAVLSHVGVVSADDPMVKPRFVTYSQDIRPLLEKHCVECHSGWFPDGGLRLDTIDAILKGGKSGPAIVPGFPDKGWLTYSLSTAANRRMQMPPSGDRLSQSQVDLIKEWLKQGAR